jgi:hypothetical protein
MAGATDATSLVPVQPVFTEAERLALAGVPGRVPRPDPRGVVGTSRSPISLSEHRVEFRVGPDRADILRAAAGDGDLGRPFQCLLT